MWWWLIPLSWRRQRRRREGEDAAVRTGGRLRIAFAIGSLDVGGTETQVCRLASELTKQGHYVIVLALGGGPLAAQLDRDGVPWRSFGFTGFGFRRWQWPVKIVPELGRVVSLWWALRGLRLDVCHAFLFWAYVLTIPGAAIVGVPLRVSGRRGLSSTLVLSRAERKLQILANWLSHLVVANSEAVRADVLATENVSAGKLRVIVNGVDLPSRQANPAVHPPTGVVLANLRPYKGHKDLLYALAGLSDPPVIRLLGEGTERSALQALIDELGLGKCCRLEGHHPQPASVLMDAQFAVLPSHTEGMPNAVLEAMAAGLPVVATRVGGVPELVETGVNGYVVAPRSPAELRNAIEEIAASPQLRSQMGRAAIERARCFDWSACTQAHLALYRRV